MHQQAMYGVTPCSVSAASLLAPSEGLLQPEKEDETCTTSRTTLESRKRNQMQKYQTRHQRGMGSGVFPKPPAWAERQGRVNPTDCFGKVTKFKGQGHKTVFLLW
uniref:Uncharacterized protein n=1 Tax=Eutreptiella gymnastica TaxID=73025 RepID=A0A7S1HRY6_9EUGL|mmetsp:Transcript_10092/g.17832  ORF Transcript_10092/g.17832 Transcript_10092/m.17832 type:complete len:105 (+) Transcript_10092:172-486(+)